MSGFLKYKDEFFSYNQLQISFESPKSGPVGTSNTFMNVSKKGECIFKIPHIEPSIKLYELSEVKNTMKNLEDEKHFTRRDVLLYDLSCQFVILKNAILVNYSGFNTNEDSFIEFYFQFNDVMTFEGPWLKEIG